MRKKARKSVSGKFAGQHTLISFFSFNARENIQADDVERIRQLVRDAAVFSEEEIDISAELVRERLEKGVASGYYFIMGELENRFCGYTCFGPVPASKESFSLYWIVLENSFRSQGVGKRLLDITEKRVLEMGGRRLYAETSSREVYAPARKFYLSNGFEQVALFDQYYAPDDDKIVYLKILGKEKSPG